MVINHWSIESMLWLRLPLTINHEPSAITT
jgi:hypothetical protein